MKPRLLLAFFVVIATLVFGQNYAPQERPGAAEVVQGPIDIAGRPGAFRFYTDEEMRAKRIEIAELRASVDRLRGTLEKLAARDPELRRQVQAELEMWNSHLGREEQRMEVSVSSTASVAERRLTEMKGTRSCGTCHAGGPVTRSDF